MTNRLCSNSASVNASNRLMDLPESLQMSVFANVAFHKSVMPETYDGPEWYPASWQRNLTLMQVTTPVVDAACSRDQVMKNYMKFVKEADISLGEIRTKLKMHNLYGGCAGLRDKLRARVQITELSTLRSENERVLSVRFNKDNTHKAVVIRVHRMSVDSLLQSQVDSIVQSECHASLVSQMKALLVQQRQQVRYFDADVAIDLTGVLETLSAVERVCNARSLYEVLGASTTDKRKHTLTCDRIVYRRVKSWLKRQSHHIILHSCKQPETDQSARIIILVRFDVYAIEAVVTLPDTIESGNANDWKPLLLQAVKAPRTLDLFLVSRTSLDSSELQVHATWLNRKLDDAMRTKLSACLQESHQFDSSEEHYAAINELLQYKHNTIREWINSHRSVWYKHIFCTFNFLFDTHGQMYI